MAPRLDLEEQEQLDQLKAFWQQYGSLVTWLLVLVLAAYAGWNAWTYYQRDQGEKSGSLYDEFDRAAKTGDVDLTARIFADMKSRFPRTAFTQQAALMTAKVQLDKGKADDARANLAWVADNGIDEEYRAIARLRLAGVLLDEKKYDDALKQLDAVTVSQFAPLANDRRGDVLMASGKVEEAKAAYLKAWSGLDAEVDYRRLVEAKLNVLGVQPTAGAASAAASGGAVK